MFQLGNRKFLKTIAVMLLLPIGVVIFGQTSSFNFLKVTTENGLTDPAIRCFAQDKFGYIWVGTLNGLNRFNGYEVKTYQHRLNDIFSLRENNVASLLTDREGTLWLSQLAGISRYDYHTGNFIFQQGSDGFSAYKMVELNSNEIMLHTVVGMVLYNKKTGLFQYLKDNKDKLSSLLLNHRIHDFCITSNGNLYLASDTGLIIYNPITKRAVQKNIDPIKTNDILRIAIDANANIWMSYGQYGSSILQTDSSFKKYNIYAQFIPAKGSLADNQINSIFADKSGRIWLSTARSGLCRFDIVEQKFISYEKDPYQSGSISDNLTTSIFQDKEGFVWVGTEGNGFNYFHPDKTFFHSIQPSLNQSPTLPNYWGRAAGEDKNGDLWLATASGIAKYNVKQNKYTLFQHTKDDKDALPYNSIRSVLCDDDWIWIGTGAGVNRYNIATDKMQSFGEKDGLPASFFWSIIKDHDNNIWFGCRDGIYKFNKKTASVEHVFKNTQLDRYASLNTVSIFEDSRKRMWFGFYFQGLLMYDAANGISRYWDGKDTGKHSLSDNRVTSITEDKNGIVWIATLDGLNAYNSTTDKFTQYLRGSGEVSEKTAALMVDKKNRLWLAANKGLYMLDSARKYFKHFGINDGLPTLDFNAQSAYELSSGDYIYPTLKGFVLFDPANYSEKNNSADIYISSFKVFTKELDSDTTKEDKKEFLLNYKQTFFSLEMLALNYGNPNETWYAHKLVPFEKDWVYSKERSVNYTNVPGGDYTFYFKSSVDVNNWDTPEKSIRVFVATVYYKTWWFRLLLVVIIADLIYTIYKIRINQKENVLLLRKKAYSLEKEKALVMYESLKQQLNPHFLFNSLTSLSSLITSSPANAKVFLDRMSKIYRYILKSRDTETVSLEDEIKLVEIYTQLQQTRFKEGLQLAIDIPEEYLERKIAPVTLQNLIENAIKHNIIDKEFPLIIDISVDEEWLVVQNNLQKKAYVESSNKQGLANMKSLYYYLSGKQILVDEDENNFTVKIPLL